MENEKATGNKMGYGSVGKLLLSMGIPMIISMAIQALYNIVDSYFVSCMKDTDTIKNMSDYAMNALTLAFPVQMLMVAIGVGTGVGINALLSRSLGEGNRKKASYIAGNSIFLAICTFIVFLLFGIFGIDAYVKSQTNDPVIIDMTKSYLQICTNFSLGIVMYVTYEKLLQATGKTMLTTIAQIAGAVVNIILDPIMIFGYFGFKEMGIEGAAYATVIGQFVSFILDAVFHYAFNKSDMDTGFKYMKPDIHIIGEIYKIGIPAVIMQALMSFMTYGVNIIFGMVSATAVTAYGIYYKIQQFVFFAAFGMNNAMIPIIAFNYGMGDRKRVKQGIVYGTGYILVMMAICLVVMQIFASQISGIFAVSDETMTLCIMALRIITLGYLFAGVNISLQGVFQSLDYGVHSLVLSVVRLLVPALPLAWLFTRSADAEKLIWWAFPVSELCGTVIALVFMKNIYKKVSKS